MDRQELYRQEELKTAVAAQKRVRLAMEIAGGAGLLLCVALCCLATRDNQRITLPLTVGASVLSGWIVIFLSHSRYELARARVRHTETMLTGPRETYTGRFSQQTGAYRVKGGVSIRRVRLMEAYHETMLTVSEEKASRLPKEFQGTVETVYDCIVAFQEEGAA